MNLGGTIEANFGLLRMHVDVHARRVDIDEQEHGRIETSCERIAVGRGDRMGEHSVLHLPAVHEDVQRIAP